MSIAEVVVLSVAGVIILSVLKTSSPVITTVVRISVLCVVLVGILPDITGLVASLESIYISENISTDSVKILLKVFVVLCSGSVASDICRDNGEASIASVVEIVSKLLAISLCVPVISAVVSVAIGFLS